MKTHLIRSLLISIFCTTVLAEVPLKWEMTAENVVRVGSLDDLPDFSWAVLPKGAFKHAEEILGAPPWAVNKIQKFSNSGASIICISNEKGLTVRYAVIDSAFFYIGGGDAMRILSEVMGKRLEIIEEDSRKTSLYSFCGDVAYLFRGPKRKVLASSFSTQPHGIAAWLRGKATDKQKLLDFCQDPSVENAGHELSVKFNLITGEGALEVWDVKILKKDGQHLFQDIKIEVIFEDGTFSWGLVP